MNNPLNEKPDWDRLEADVVIRIRALRALCGHWEMDDTMVTAPLLGDWLKRHMWKDMVLPNVRLLAEFCSSVKVHEEEP